MSADPRVTRLKDFYETISPQSVADLRRLYTEDAYFKDPFNEVRGIAAVEGIFAHMFVQVEAPRFRVHDAVVQGEQGFLTWDFLFRFKGSAQEQIVHGASHLRFAADGRVAFHRDYWDAAEELYEKLPVLGALMRFLKRRVAQ